MNNHCLTCLQTVRTYQSEKNLPCLWCSKSWTGFSVRWVSGYMPTWGLLRRNSLICCVYFAFFLIFFAVFFVCLLVPCPIFLMEAVKYKFWWFLCKSPILTVLQFIFFGGVGGENCQLLFLDDWFTNFSWVTRKHSFWQKNYFTQKRHNLLN